MTESQPAPLSPVVVDGRVDGNKLHELLALGAEYSELDFKRTLNLGKSETKSNLDFVKDALAMSNTVRGGYLVVGAADNGAPAHGSEPINPSHFDSAILKDKVSAYVDGHVDIASQVHTVAGREIALIYIAPASGLIPHLTAKAGKIDGSIIIPQGVIYTRQGTQNVIATSSDLTRLLEPFRAAAMSEGRSHVDGLIRTLTQSLAGSTGGVPMLIDSDLSTFAEALRSNLGSDNVKRIKGFIQTAQRDSKFNLDDETRTGRLRALDKLALIAVETCSDPSTEVFIGALTALSRSYNSTGFHDVYSTPIINPDDVARTRHFVDVLARVYLIGAAAVREENFDVVRQVAMVSALRPNSTHSEFLSWLRHGITYASRSGVLSPSIGHETLLAEARQLGQDSPELVTGSLAALTERESNALLSDLTAFDIAWCVAAAASTTAGNEIYEMYTSFAGVQAHRGESMLVLITSNRKVRQALAPDATDADFARAIDEVLTLASRESFRGSGFWLRAKTIPNVAEFIKNHKEGPA